MDIVSKFTLASEEGLHNLFLLKKDQLLNMYRGSVQQDVLNEYIEVQLNKKDALRDLNNMSSQMITVFAEDVPVGYVIMKQSLSRPKVLTEQKAINYASFYIMHEHDNAETRASLWNKCLSVTHNYDAMWIEVLQTAPLIPFLESCGFQRHEQSEMKPFDKASYILIRPKMEN